MKVTRHIEQLLRQGRKPKELIELGFSKSAVTRVRRRLRREKAALKTKTVTRAQVETQLSTPPESPETITTIWQKVQSIEDELKKMKSYIPALSEMADMIGAARQLGTDRRQGCPFQEDGLCELWLWGSQDEIPEGMGEAVRVGDENPEWRLKPSALYCAMCIASLYDDMADLEDRIADESFSGVRHQFTCNSCGSKGWVAFKVKCAQCGHEGYFGWWPEEE